MIFASLCHKVFGIDLDLTLEARCLAFLGENFQRKNRDDLFVILLGRRSSSHNPPIRLPVIWCRGKIRSFACCCNSPCQRVGFSSLAETAAEWFRKRGIT